MDDSEQPSQEQSPSQRIVAVASIACFVSVILIYIYWSAKPAVESGSVELLVCAIIPLSVTFIILYRSGWHREIMGVARTCSLLLLSGAILGGVLIAIGFMFCVLMFLLNAVSGGFHP